MLFHRYYPVLFWYVLSCPLLSCAHPILLCPMQAKQWMPQEYQCKSGHDLDYPVGSYPGSILPCSVLCKPISGCLRSPDTSKVISRPNSTILICAILPVLSWPVLFWYVLSCPTLSSVHPILLCPMLAKQWMLQEYQYKSSHVLDYPIGSYPVPIISFTVLGHPGRGCFHMQ